MLLKRIISEIKRRKSFLKFLHIYTFTNIIETAIPFFLMPVLTRLLSTFDYGIIVTFNAIKTNANPVISMATPGAPLAGHTMIGIKRDSISIVMFITRW